MILALFWSSIPRNAQNFFQLNSAYASLRFKSPLHLQRHPKKSVLKRL